MKRSEVESKYKWKLEDMFSSDEKWEEMFNAVSARVDEINAYKGKLSNKQVVLDCLKLNDEIGACLEKMYCYARMRKDEDGAVDKYVSMADRSEMLLIRYGTNASFFESEISKVDKNLLLSFIKDPEFSNYDFMLEEILRTKKYILSDKEERILAMSQSSTGMFAETFTMLDNVDIKRPDIKVDGEMHKLTHGSYSYFLQNKNPKVRKAAFEGTYSSYKALINTLAANYSGNVKSDNFYAKARGYDNFLEKALFVEGIPTKVYDNLIKYINKNLKGMHKYVALRKKALGVKTLNMWDMHVPIVDAASISVEYDEAYQMVIDGLKPLGKEYEKLLVTARDQGWIDVVETENKRAGAYSWGAYGTHPYVLLNYAKTTGEIFTIAHELGHAMHTYYSNKSLPYSKASYKIFVAEVASTVNEVLLLKHLISTAKDKNLKKFLLSYYLDMFRTTMFRQTMFAEFEKNTHDMEQRGEPLTVVSLSDMYLELNKKYYGRSVKHNELIKYEWARIPHLYRGFYVYKYATGLTSAVNIAAMILRDPSYVETYKKFLSAGGTKSPYDVLKDANVDLATKEPYEVAQQEFINTLEALEKELEVK